MTKSRGLLDAEDGQNGAIALIRFNLASQLTVEVLPGAWRQVLGQLGEIGSMPGWRKTSGRTYAMAEQG